jgi:hypothetical protein
MAAEQKNRNIINLSTCDICRVVCHHRIDCRELVHLSDSRVRNDLAFHTVSISGWPLSVSCARELAAVPNCIEFYCRKQRVCPFL